MRALVRRLVMAASATAAAGGPLLHAQSPAQGGAAATPELTVALQALRPGHLVRISAGGARDTGRVALASTNQLAFRHRPDRDAMPASSIDSLWTWTSNKGTGARTGAIVVGALGAVALSTFGGATLDYEPDKSKTAIVGGIVGALLGAAFGAAIGDQFSHWTLVHPRRPRAP